MTSAIRFTTKVKTLTAGGVAQWLKALVAQAEGPGMTPSPHDSSPSSVTPVPGIWYCLLTSAGTRHAD